jgi:hypothetical protein
LTHYLQVLPAGMLQPGSGSSAPDPSCPTP